MPSTVTAVTAQTGGFATCPSLISAHLAASYSSDSRTGSPDRVLPTGPTVPNSGATGVAWHLA